MQQRLDPNSALQPGVCALARPKAVVAVRAGPLLLLGKKTEAFLLLLAHDASAAESAGWRREQGQLYKTQMLAISLSYIGTVHSWPT